MLAVATVILSLFISPAFAQNLVKNGDFEGGLNAQGEPVAALSPLGASTSANLGSFGLST